MSSGTYSGHVNHTAEAMIKVDKLDTGGKCPGGNLDIAVNDINNNFLTQEFMQMAIR